MKQRIYILLVALVAVLPMYAAVDLCELFGSDLTNREVCEQCAIQQKAPYYYCDCHMGTELYYGLDTVITDTTWLWVRVKDVRTKGVSAFWFSESPINIEAYIQCAQVTPQMEKTVGANRIYMLDNADMQKLVDASGLGATVDNFKIRFRVYPTKQGSTGRFIAFPYGEGLLSTCQTEVFPIFFGLRYPLSYSENVYRLAPENIPASPFFVQWRQDKGKPAVLSISLGECTAEPVVKDVRLLDSTKVYFPSADLLQKAKDENKTLFFHCAHADDVYGTLSFVNPVQWETTRIDTAVCYGKSLDLITVLLDTDTCYRDTAWLSGNTCILTEYNLTIVQPEPIDTTLCWTIDELRTQRFLGFKKFAAFGTYDVYHEKDGECTELYHVTVVENILSSLHDASAVFSLAPTGAKVGQPVELRLHTTAQVVLTDLLGRIVVSTTLQPGTHTFTPTAAGNYFLQLRTAEAVYNQRLIIR